jgi:hypothetical protein
MPESSVKRQCLLELVGALLLVHQSTASKHEIRERQKRKLGAYEFGSRTRKDLRCGEINLHKNALDRW